MVNGYIKLKLDLIYKLYKDLKGNEGSPMVINAMAEILC